MTAEYDLSASDYRAFRRYAFFKLRKLHYVYIICVGLFSWLTWNGAKDQPLLERIATVLVLWLMFVLVVLALTVVMTLIYKFRRTGFRPTLGRHRLEVSEDGVAESNDNGRSEIKLAGIQRIDETKSHFFVVTKSGTGFIIPKRALQTLDELRALRERTRVRPG